MKPSFYFPSNHLEQYNPWDHAGPGYDFEVEYGNEGAGCEHGCRTRDDHGTQECQREYIDYHRSNGSCSSESCHRRGSDDWSDNSPSPSSCIYDRWMDEDHDDTMKSNSVCGCRVSNYKMEHYCGSHYEESGDSSGSWHHSQGRLTREEWRRLEWKELKKELQKEIRNFKGHYCRHCSHCSSSNYSRPDYHLQCSTSQEFCGSESSLPDWKKSESSCSGIEDCSFSPDHLSSTNSSLHSRVHHGHENECSVVGNRKIVPEIQTGGEDQWYTQGGTQKLDKTFESDSQQKSFERTEYPSGVQTDDRKGLKTSSGTGAKKIEKTSSSEITSGGCAAQRSSRFSGGDVCEIMLAPKKEPAFREEKRQVQLLTNFWELKVQSKIVYRHDVAVYLGIPENQRAFDLLRGFRDDTATVARRKLCTDAVRYAIGYYHILSEGSAVVHDGGGMLFSSENLTPALKEYDGVLPITVHELEYEYYRFIRDDVRRHINKITIEITPCREAVSSFDMANLSSQVGTTKFI
ncbi:hypothetical protein RB195_005529 [Necator americanus]|uniref:Uncharacterized protein n=1 Tax=Necator americanus TaxID=51031 RepID=A0ABR1BS71_NECAM